MIRPSLKLLTLAAGLHLGACSPAPTAAPAAAPSTTAATDTEWRYTSATLTGTETPHLVELWVRDRDGAVVNRESRDGRVVFEARCQDGVLATYDFVAGFVVSRGDDVDVEVCSNIAGGKILQARRALAKGWFGNPRREMYQGAEATRYTYQPEGFEVVLDAKTLLPLEEGKAGDAAHPLMRWTYSAVRVLVAEAPPLSAQAGKGWGFDRYTKVSPQRAAEAIMMVDRAATELPRTLAGLPLAKSYQFQSNHLREPSTYAIWSDGKSEIQAIHSSAPLWSISAGVSSIEDAFEYQNYQGTGHLKIHASDMATLKVAIEALRPSALLDANVIRPMRAAGIEL
jgi:hypothetical protein